MKAASKLAAWLKQRNINVSMAGGVINNNGVINQNNEK